MGRVARYYFIRSLCQEFTKGLRPGDVEHIYIPNIDLSTGIYLTSVSK
jgi:hypothetical protein